MHHFAAFAAVAAAGAAAAVVVGAAATGVENPPQVPHPPHIRPIILEARAMLNISKPKP